MTAALSRIRMRSIAVLAVCLGAVCAWLAAGGVPAASAKTTSKPKPNRSTFITTLDTSVSTFNPFLSFEQGEIDVEEMIYPFLTFDNANGYPGPYLATSWSTSPNKLTWTFHLRTGLKWSDGVPLTSKDVAWTLNLIMHNATAGTANGTLVADFKSVTAPNPATVVITTDKPLANMLNDVSIPIVPEHIWKSHVKKLAGFTNTQTPVVGYGPYQFTGYRPDQDVTLTASKSFFWKREPKYHTLILDYFADTSGAVAALRNGEVNSTYQLTDTEWNALGHVPGIKTYQNVSNDWVAVEVNGDARTRSGKPMGNGNPLLHNIVIRHAIAMAINRAEIVRKVVGGAGTVTASYLTKAYPKWYWAPPTTGAQNYNPAAANAMLTKAGFPMGKNGYRYSKATGKELSFRLGIHSDYANDAATANYLVGFLKAVGIKLNVQAMSNTQLNDNLAIGDWDLLMDQWPEGSDPTYLLSIQTCGVLPTNSDGSGGNTDSFFCNKRYDQLYTAEQEQFNVAKRAADIKAMEKILYNADYDIILYDDNTLWATHTNVLKGYLYGKPNAQGLYPNQNYELGWITAVPAASTGGGSSSTLIVVIIVVVLVVLGAGGLLVTRRRRVTAEERE